jgi:hypothetical protein
MALFSVSFSKKKEEEEEVRWCLWRLGNLPDCITGFSQESLTKTKIMTFAFPSELPQVWLTREWSRHW